MGREGRGGYSRVHSLDYCFREIERYAVHISTGFVFSFHVSSRTTDRFANPSADGTSDGKPRRPLGAPQAAPDLRHTEI